MRRRFGFDRGKPKTWLLLVVFVVVFGVIGSLLLHAIHAQTATSSIESENGTINGCASSVSDTSASNSHAVVFQACAGSTDPSAGAGATLPISYNLSSLTGTVVYVSPSGSDSGSGTVSSPYATLSKAISAAPAGGTIVLRGGTYSQQGGLTISKSLKIIAYPGETPIFDGAAPVSGGWTAAGSLSYRSYTPMPVTDGSGISFTTCANQSSSCMGKYPDQVWVGSQQLQQVASQAAVTTGTFWVDSTNDRLYMTATDINKGNVEISGQRKFASVSAANVTLEGFEIIRYSNTASDYGVVSYSGTADTALLDEMYISDSAFIAVNFGPTNSDLNEHSTIQDSTILYSNWMGVSANATNYFTLDHDEIGDMNQFGEFTSSPQSGSLKTSRTWYTKVLNSKIMNNNATHGLWFDQSNYDVEVAGNDIENNGGAGLFFEISDYLYAVNNYFYNNQSDLRMVGSSDLFIVNNTLIGGAYPAGVGVDSRSIAGCSDPAQPVCSGSISSDRDTYHTHLATMTWIPSLDMLLDNVIGYPSGSGSCSSSAGLCITEKNGSADVPINTIIHPADTANGVPQTVIDGNVYANGSGNIIDTVALGNFTTPTAFAGALAGAPVNIGGFEVHSLAGNSYVGTDGTPTAALTALQGSAAAVPTNTIINTYVPAGTKHYGVTWK